MVMIHICCNSVTDAHGIANFLLDEKLLSSASINNNLSTMGPGEKSKSGSDQTLLFGTTKALLFHKIDTLLKSKFPGTISSIYAIPIIYMGEQEAQKVKNETQKV